MFALHHKQRIAVIPWLSSGIYDRKQRIGSHVSVEFSPKIEPYLYELKEKFTLINFSQASKLDTPFSFRLYQWLIKARNMIKHRKGEAVKVVLDVEWIKNQTNMVNKYEQWKDFGRYVIKPAVERINTKTDISVAWTPVKTGRRVTAIEFSYIEETAKETKPLRPRLYRRPKVLKASHEEGIWMRKNAELLLDYLGRSLEYNPDFKLTIPDLKKLITYVSIYDSSLERQLKLELNFRQKIK